MRITIGKENISYFQLVGDIEEDDIRARDAFWALGHVNMRSCCTFEARVCVNMADEESVLSTLDVFFWSCFCTMSDI